MTDAMTRPPMVTDAFAAAMKRRLALYAASITGFPHEQFDYGDLRELVQFAQDASADRERTLRLLRESIDDQLREDDVGNGDKRLRCDMCQVVLTYWRAKDGGTHERPHRDGCLIPKWEALLKEVGRGA